MDKEVARLLLQIEEKLQEQRSQIEEKFQEQVTSLRAENEELRSEIKSVFALTGPLLRCVGISHNNSNFFGICFVYWIRTIKKGEEKQLSALPDPENFKWNDKFYYVVSPPSPSASHGFF